jgi:hypothetical protein
VGIHTGTGATASGGKSAAASAVTIGSGSGRKSLGGLVVAGIGVSAVRVKKKPSAPHLRLECIHLRISLRGLRCSFIGQSTE